MNKALAMDGRMVKSRPIRVKKIESLDEQLKVS